MNAQEKWKLNYINFCRSILFKIGSKDDWRMDMWNCRREAALERKLEAAQRTIEAQASELNHYRRLQADIDMGVIELVMPGEVAEVIDSDELGMHR